MSNLFGGANSKALYTPLSDVEQECLHRLIDNNLLKINIVGWGYVENPKAVFGDLRLGLTFTLNFNRPEIPMPVPYLDLELVTKSGITLFKERQSTMYNGQPLMVGAGLYLDLAWDIAITAIDPKVVKKIVPSVRGLTSRWVDKHTDRITLLGNTTMSEEHQKALIGLRQQEALNRKDTVDKAKKASS